MKLRLVDKVVSWQRNESLTAIKAVSFEEYSLRAGTGLPESLPETLAIGAMLEAASWLTILSTDFEQMAWPEEISSCEIHASPAPGERMTIAARRITRGESLAFHLEACIGDRTAILIPCLTARPLPLQRFHDPADLRTLFSEIGPQS